MKHITVMTGENNLILNVVFATLAQASVVTNGCCYITNLYGWVQFDWPVKM